MTNPTIERIERSIRRDPAQRGLIGSETEFGPLCVGHLAAAAQDLATSAGHVGIVTGFYVPRAEPPAAETDGLLGSLMLAHALRCVGVDVSLITDEPCAGALHAAAGFVSFPAERLHVAPLDADGWTRSFLTETAGGFTHLVAIERPGPSHTEESLLAQDGRAQDAAIVLERFRSEVPPAHRDRCHNMRGTPIDAYTAGLHQLFEGLGRANPTLRTIGIGDGGNEIGMGSIAWEELERRVEGEHAGRILCRIATDWTIIAGTTNWGGYALAASVLLIRDRVGEIAAWDARHQQQMLEHIVRHGPAVDGITALHEATVDGLPFLTYIQVWEAIRRILGFDS